ncbi:MAG: DUF2156 domain-containing protein [Dehalococcoidia bacterium]|nr:MAG: DUF2156 domain-containing protein [Dehalococcoidia bacterium]
MSPRSRRNVWTRRSIAAAGLGLAIIDGLSAILKAAPGRQSLWQEATGGALPGTPRFFLLLASLLLLLVTPGLLRAKRQAWAIALLATTISIGVHSLRLRDVDDVGLLASVAVAILLVGTARSFRTRSDPVRMRQGVIWFVAGEAVVFLFGFLGLFLLDREFAEPADIPEAVVNALRLLFVLPDTTITPVTRHGRYFVDAVRALASVVAAVAVWHLLHPVLHRTIVAPRERERVRRLLEAYGTTSLAPFHLLHDKTYFFASDGEAFVSYVLAGGSAVALGEPVGAPAARREVAREFAEFCELSGWRYCFYQATPAGAEELAGLGFRRLKIGEEAIVQVQQFTLTGKASRHLRNVQNRLGAEGVYVVELPQPIDDPTMAELQEVSDAWLADGGHRERGFTLGVFSPDYLRATRVFAVRRADGTIEAFANVLPSFMSPDSTFDLMRRRPDSTNGVMDLLMLHLIESFRQAGVRGMNLGLAPLARIEGSGPVALAERILYERGSAVFNFQGLRAYKDKWQPQWEDRFLAYRSTVDLPMLAVAIARAGEGRGILARLFEGGTARFRRWLRARGRGARAASATANTSEPLEEARPV